MPPASTTVTFELVPRRDGTLVRVTHGRLPDSGAAGTHARGWDHYLPRLAAAASGANAGVDPWISSPAL